MSYDDAMVFNYGSDKPDTRFDMLQGYDEVVKGKSVC